MFGFLKDKLKDVISKFSQKVEEESEVEEKVNDIKEELDIVEDKAEIKEEPKKKVREKKGTKRKEKHSETIKHKAEIKEEPKKEIVIKENIQEINQEVEEHKKGFFSKLKEKFTLKAEEFDPKELSKESNEISSHKKNLEVYPIPIEKDEKKGLFSSIKEKLTTTKISQERFNELFNELELTMLENNVALEVIDKIREDLMKDLLDKPIKRSAIEETIKLFLKESIEDLFLVNRFDLIQKINTLNKKPYVICFVGQNGAGKTTTIAKVTNYLQKYKKSVILAAADTFRAASIEQIKEWGNRLNVKVIAHDYGSDPAAVCFDSIEFAKSHNIDVVLIDTAGRQHSNKNLMQEMEKIIRVSKPDMKIFIGESITGNDALEQSQDFNDSIGIDGVILTKTDIDEKGGAIISISYVIHRPIIFLGTGQNLDDLKEFNKNEILEKIGLN